MQVGPGKDTLPCSVLGCEFPRSLMRHAHIFPKAKRAIMPHFLGMDDVHAGSNGILLAKPVQVSQLLMSPCYIAAMQECPIISASMCDLRSCGLLIYTRQLPVASA